MSSKKIKILITGGGGFIGKALAIRLYNLEYDVYSLSRKIYPEHQTIGIKSIKANLLDLEALELACQNIDIVFHVAAKVGMWGKYQDFYDVNVKGTENLINACLKQKVKELIFTSSASVVFDGRDIEGGNESLPYPMKPQSYYTGTKAEAEKLILKANSKSLKTLVLRPHIVWGPGDTNIIPGIISRAKKGNLRLVGYGNKLIDTTYIENLINAQIDALNTINNENVAGNAYFISDDNPISIHEFINSILEQFGYERLNNSTPKSIAIISSMIIETYYRIFKRKIEPPITRFIAEELSSSHWFDINSAKQMLHYKPTISIKKGLNILSRNYKKLVQQS